MPNGVEVHVVDCNSRSTRLIGHPDLYIAILGYIHISDQCSCADVRPHTDCPPDEAFGYRQQLFQELRARIVEAPVVPKGVKAADSGRAIRAFETPASIGKPTATLRLDPRTVLPGVVSGAKR